MTGSTYQELVAAYRRRADRPRGELDHVPGTGERLAYNPCLIAEPDRTWLAVRVESPKSYWRDQASWDPQVHFFERTPDGWHPVPDAPVFTAAEDPFAAWMTGPGGRPQLVLGVVTLDHGHTPPLPVTRFHAAPDVRSLDPAKPFLEVPGMKDIRLLQRDGDVVVCGRPQGGTAGIGRISVAVTDSYTSITPELIASAHVFIDQVAPDTKVGTNELYDLGGGTVGVLGHIALGEEGSTQRYAAAWWTIDPDRRTTTAPVVVAVRDDFPPAPAKYPVISDVVFPGSLEALPDGRFRMYCGLGDAALGSVTLALPADLPHPADGHRHGESRHLSTFIDRPLEEVYEYAANPANLPAWAPGLCTSVELVDGRWVAESGMGRFLLDFAPRNPFGVLDHDVTLASGETFHNPMRVIADGSHSEVVFTLRRRPGVADADFDRDAEAVLADLAALKRVLEGSEVPVA
ncbi:hypothetical protein GCM10010399_65060 [Dactylosporangium fulvum]|uniref:DUF1861 family protein n=1 Tax=Dactylosporangium fulvum TaxID=53359 RepID=A0ABY5VMM8_9ACTN|nr:DUF1861 family protein [Dactylosporangium fulvum]UWP78878.1 DUF1861 family protein [Dactylosporangium fulvum]